MKKTTPIRRLAMSVIAGAGLMLFAFVIPVLGAPDPDADRLHMTSRGDAFTYGEAGPSQIVQPVRQGASGCVISPTSGADGPLVTLTAAALNGGGVRGPGLFDHGIGVKSGGSNGTPCSETSGTEQLIIASKGNSWFELLLNAEAKGNAWIKVELVSQGVVIQTHQLLTGSSIAAYNNQNGTSLAPNMTFPYTATTVGDGGVAACADPSDSGADSGPNDNCLWTVQAGAVFDTVRMSTLVGAVSLEGGHDFEAFDPSGAASGLYDSLFYRYQAPVAEGDAYTTDEDTTLTVATPGVLANDSDDLGLALTAALVDGPAHGTVTLNGDGSFQYVPAENYFGDDTFTYRATAGGVPSNVATVAITVNSVNDGPVARGEDLSATEDTASTFSGSDLATDVDGDPLAITAAEAANGDATVNADGTITYVPATDSCEPDALISFTVEDGNGGTLTGSVVINIECVNDAPVAVDDAYETDERDPLGPVTLNVPAPGVLGNDTDVDGDTLEASNATGAGGSVTLNADGSFAYTPGPHVWGPEEFSYVDTWDYTVSDGNSGTDTGAVSITVYRVICSDETVTDVDGFYSGSFTLLTPEIGCKRYEVDADATAQSITFTPDPREGQPQAFFRGELTFAPQVLNEGGTFSLGLSYDPDNEGPLESRTVQVCLDPVFDPTGRIISATIPTGETWCFAGALSLASATTGGEITTLFQVIGTEDPEFQFR